MTFLILFPTPKNCIFPPNVCVFSEVACTCVSGVLTEALHCSLCPDFGWLIPPSYTHTHFHTFIDLFCLDFHWFFFFASEIAEMQCQLYILSVCVPVIKEEKAAEGEGRYKCYWNCHLIFPMLSACPLRQRVVSPLHTKPGGFSSQSVLFIHVFSVWAWMNTAISLVTSHFHAVSLQSCLLHRASVNVISQCKVRSSLTLEAEAILLHLNFQFSPSNVYTFLVVH